MQPGDKVYITSNRSGHRFPIRSTVMLNSVSAPVAYCSRINGSDSGMVYLDEISKTRPVKQMRVFIFGDRKGDLAYEFKNIGHIVTHEFCSSDPAENTRLLVENSKDKDLVIAFPEFRSAPMLDYLKTDIFLTLFSLRVKKVCFISEKHFSPLALRPADQNIYIDKILGRKKDFIIKIWHRGLKDIDLTQLPSDDGRTFRYDIARRMVEAWTQFTLRSNTKF